MCFNVKSNAMKKIFLLLSFAAFLNISGFSQSVNDYVDLFICTAGDHGQLDPAACVPFGMVKLGPDTYPVNHSGYNYQAEYITGFSHNRVGGVGCKGVGGNIRILPGVGELVSKSLYVKSTEKAEPGYYEVTFNNGIQAQLAATNHTGIHNYTFPESNEAFIRIDYKSSFDKLIHAEYQLDNNTEITGSVAAKNVCGRGRYTVFFHLESNKPFERYEEIDGVLYAFFKTNENEEVTLEVTLSPISPQQAKKDKKATLEGKSFDDVKQAASKKWEDLLGRIELEGKEEYKKIFYTHLYHIFLNPVNSTSTDGEYRGTDGRVYKAEGYTHYDSWSIWDNFRNKFSLYSVLIPEITGDIGRSMVDLYRSGKSKWASHFEPTPTVRTEHSSLVLLDMYKRGIEGIDLESIYTDIEFETSYHQAFSPDMALEIAYDYWGLAQIANILGKQKDHTLFMDRAMEYKKVWKKHFLTLEEDADSMHARGLYEGTIWQYRWHVQFDVDGIIEMIGGKEKYLYDLEFFFDNDLYNHGNQPDIHVPFMFNFGGAPWLTQKWVNKILAKEDMVQYYGTHGKWEKPYIGRVYKAEPKGYIKEMDDDEGTMSAWYVLSSMGMYPVLVGEPEFQLSAPVFEKVTIHLESGKTFEIVCKNISDENFYIQSTRLNGKEFNQSFIPHNSIMDGGKLTYYLSDKPNKKWGVNPE